MTSTISTHYEVGSAYDGADEMAALRAATEHPEFAVVVTVGGRYDFALSDAVQRAAWHLSHPWGE